MYVSIYRAEILSHSMALHTVVVCVIWAARSYFARAHMSSARVFMIMAFWDWVFHLYACACCCSQAGYVLFQLLVACWIMLCSGSRCKHPHNTRVWLFVYELRSWPVNRAWHTRHSRHTHNTSYKIKNPFTRMHANGNPHNTHAFTAPQDLGCAHFCQVLISVSKMVRPR